MPTKTDRIISYLPGTFRPAAQLSALRAYLGGFGEELQQGENQLAELVQSHWVDFADRGAAEVLDLARIAALYGLAPRDDESVEEFREHLKRYVRTFLEGTVTVQGILRIAAETLGLTIADRPEELDRWWARTDDELVTVSADESDATPMLLGVADVDEHGTAARRAEIHGTPDLTGGVDLSEHNILYIAVDAGPPVVVDLTQDAPEPTAVSLNHIVDRIRTELSAAVARADDGHLVVASPTIGPGSRLEVREGPDDAATATLGLLPLSYRGRDETSARVTSVDLSAGADLTNARFLRLLVDGTHLAEIDLAGGDPAHTFLDEIRDAINTALGFDLASHDGQVLTLTSPIGGHESTIAIRQAAAQDAARRLFGTAQSLFFGTDAQPAIVTGTVDLSEGVDLSENSLLQVRVDDVPTVTIDCAGAVPAHTQLDEVIASVNAGIGAQVADRDRTHLVLRSPSTGDLAEVALDPVTNDAAPALLGIPPRLAEGRAATFAHFTGAPSLADGISLSARNTLEIAVDGGEFVHIRLYGGTAGITLDDLVAQINEALGSDIATHDGEHLILRSRHAGGGSALAVQPLATESRRRFVTRAFVTGEASRVLFGVDAASARGDDASRAAVVGAADLSHGVNLASARYLRVAVDGAPALDIDCAGPRPRATVLDEVIAAINAQIPDLAQHDGHRLTLLSPTSGATSQIAFETPQAQDARPMLLGVEPGTTRGQDAGGVTFLGVADLSAGVDLPAHAALKLGIDGAASVEIALTADEPATRSLGALAAAINASLGSVAHHDGTRLGLVSPTTGAQSALRFEVPDGTDATAAVFGIAAPRNYHGVGATPARLVGLDDLSASVDLSVRRYLTLSVDGGPEVVVDFAGTADPAAVSLDEIVSAINTAFQAGVAVAESNRLVLHSAATGLSGRVTVSTFTTGDARTILFGAAVPEVTPGLDPQPATITGVVDLLAPADLSRRSALRISVDGGAPRDIDVAGAAARQTSIDEVVAAIDVVLPGVALATADRRLELASRTTGIDSRLDLLPVRSLEVVEFPATERALPPRALGHGDRFTVDNTGAGDTYVTVSFDAPHGNGGPALVNFTRQTIVHLLRSVSAGDSARVCRAPDGGVHAEITTAARESVTVPASEIHAGPLGAWSFVPFPEPRAVTDSGLLLDNPFSGILDQVFGRCEGVLVDVGEATALSSPSDVAGEDGDRLALTGRLTRTDDGWRLTAADGAPLVDVRAGARVHFAGHDGAVLAVEGTLHTGDEQFLHVRHIERRFDVSAWVPDDQTLREEFANVTIGGPPGDVRTLVTQAETGPTPSTLLTARSLPKADALRLERGRSEWIALECAGSRFDAARFDEDAFAGGSCVWTGVFDIGAFSVEEEALVSVFGPSEDSPTPTNITLRWEHHMPAAFEVNLPADLPPRFGGRFDDAAFASDPEQPESYPGVVTEPADDDRNLVALLNAESVLVRSEVVATLPIGFQAVTLPFRHAQFLTGGLGVNHARLYLREDGAEGFILLEARDAGAKGNLVHVVSRPGGPARFDVTLATDGARFEVARDIVAGPGPPPFDRTAIQPMAVGVTLAKAAGICAVVTRDRTSRRQ
jgi:hypothetical protein